MGKKRKRASFTRMAPKPLTSASLAPHSQRRASNPSMAPSGHFTFLGWVSTHFPHGAKKCFQKGALRGRQMPSWPLHLALGSNLSFRLRDSEHLHMFWALENSRSC